MPRPPSGSNTAAGTNLLVIPSGTTFYYGGETTLFCYCTVGRIRASVVGGSCKRKR
jgi:hypothetical protein